MCSETIFIAGRYNKYLRNLSQSPWIDRDDVRIRDSVQELIESGLKKFLSFDKCIFSSSGREDVDVRMLGKGRPFVFKILNPFNASNFNQETMKQIQDFINSEYNCMIRVRDLQIVTKESVSKNLKEGEESKNKEYKALCCCSRPLTQDDIIKISNTTNVTINQKTPIRVLHRRSLAIRKRNIFKLNIDKVKLGDYESVKKENIDNVFAITLLTEAGTYIKEFVHGDFGRTEPSLSSLLGDCETDLMELDVMEIYLNWPPPLVGVENNPTQHNDDEGEDNHLDYCPTNKVQKTMITSITTAKDTSSSSNLEELYTEALKCLRRAESMPRGDSRQDLYLNSRRLFEHSMKLVDSLQLFSDNETIDDIATVNLKYLLIPAYLAKIFVSSECIPTGRLETLTRAEENIIKFFHRIVKYGFNKYDSRIEQAISDQKKIQDESKIELSSESRITQSLESAMQSRAEKIENYKKMKLLEKKVLDLEKKIDSGQEVDDEIIREYYTSLIEKTITDCYDSLEGEVRPALFFERNRKSSDALTKDYNNVPKPSSSKSKDSMSPKTFTILKNEQQKKVFGLGYPGRPSVTVDEFINKKMKDGELAFQKHKEVYSNSLQRYAEKPDLLRQQEELSDEEHDEKEDKDDPEELYKKRRWDEFKDENPRGSGNRHNMG